MSGYHGTAAFEDKVPTNSIVSNVKDIESVSFINIPGSMQVLSVLSEYLHYAST